jgi:hypothetical protein
MTIVMSYETIKQLTITWLSGQLTKFKEFYSNLETILSEIGTNMKTSFSESFTSVKQIVLNSLISISDFFKDYKDIILLVVGGIVTGIVLLVTGIPASIGTALAGLVLVVGGIFADVKVAAAKQLEDMDIEVTTKAEKIKNGIITAWSSITTYVANIWGGMKNIIRDNINAAIGYINILINKWNTLKITFPSVTLPNGTTWGGWSISAPHINTIDPIPMRYGGVIYKDQIFRAGEGNRREAVVPLTDVAVKPFAQSIAREVSDVMGIQSNSGNVFDGMTLQVGVLVADEMGLRTLARKLNSYIREEDLRTVGLR